MPHTDPEKRKAYHKAYGQKHYQANKELYAQRARASARKRRDDNREKVCAYLRKHPCIDCGESDLVVLDFDHRDQATKVAGVAMLLKKNVGWKRIAAEIEKCDVRCANCHRRRTARQLGWLKG